MKALDKRALEFWNNSPCQAHPAQVCSLFALSELKRMRESLQTLLDEYSSDLDELIL